MDFCLTIGSHLGEIRSFTWRTWSVIYGDKRTIRGMEILQAYTLCVTTDDTRRLFWASLPKLRIIKGSRLFVCCVKREHSSLPPACARAGRNPGGMDNSYLSVTHLSQKTKAQQSQWALFLTRCAICKRCVLHGWQHDILGSSVVCHLKTIHSICLYICSATPVSKKTKKTFSCLSPCS